MSSFTARAPDRADDISIEIARDLPALMEAFAVRAIVYMGEQACPYGEEYDGNDMTGATHLVARAGGEPVGVLRIRWFADFCKIERVAIRRERRGGAVVTALIDAAFAHAARKGYRKVLGHVEARLLPLWRKHGLRARLGRPRLRFSDREYVEVIRELEVRADALTLETPAMVLLRPEGAWDTPGILDRSAERSVPMAH
ncbi:MAG TPA: GNAT family N-acetyltransferase [Terricaulis sp.]|nr:GNAT family N-acetyltransferase [Terricaulis sp.]